MNSTIASFSKNHNEKIIHFFSEDSSILKCYAHFCGFIKRRRTLTASSLISMLTISSLSSKPTTLVNMTSALKSIDPKIVITQSALHERLISPACLLFVQKIFAEVLRINILKVVNNSYELLDSFKRVLIQDCSSWKLPENLKDFYKGPGRSGSKAALKINVMYDLKNARFIHISDHAGVKSDHTLGKESLHLIEKEDLILRDLGFLNVESLEKIEKVGAYYLSRLSGSISLRLRKNGKPISLEKLYDKYAKDGELDLWVFVGSEKHYCRLIAYKCPQEIADKRRRDLSKYSKTKGHKTTSENISRKGFNAYLTNVPIKIWPAIMIPTLYRVRWQIELIFKTCKSQMAINHFEGKNVNRLRILLYSKWIAILLCTNFYALASYCLKREFNTELSFFKLMNWLLVNEAFRKLVFKKAKKAKLIDFILEMRRTCCKDKRTRKTTMDMVETHLNPYEKVI